MTVTLSRLVQDYFYQRLMNQRDLRHRTIASYRDSIKLFLCFTKNYLNKRIDKIQIDDLTANIILKFLDYLETERKKLGSNQK